MSDLDDDTAKAELLRKRGNLYAKNREFESALNAYNESLRCIQRKESLGLTYAEKSAVCFECDEFESCLRNFQLAIDHKCPEYKLAVVNVSKLKCPKLIESDMKRGNHWEFLKLTYAANHKVPFIVDCLELNKNELNGNHIITNKDLKVGDIIAIEKPHSIVLAGVRSRCCAACGSRKPFDFIPCTLNYEMYCSKACQELALKTFHRPEAQIFSQQFSPMSMRIYMNALLLFDGSIENLQAFLCANQSPSRTIFDLDFNSSDEIENGKNRLIALFGLINDVDFTNKNTDQFVTYFLECALEVVKSNLIMPYHEYFLGIYLFSSLLKRSIAPNSVALQMDNQWLHLVIRPIAKGEQLFTNNRACKSYSVNGRRVCNRLKYVKICYVCEYKNELKKESEDLILLEPPSWPKPSWNSSERFATVQFAIERFKNYCAMLQSSPELLSINYNTLLVTDYILMCLNKVISNRPLD
ncbi:unnamed protein product [Diamesa hyperborea]